MIENHFISIEDKLNTLGHHLTQTITKAMSLDSNLPLLVTGGGAYNKFWVDLFKDYGIKLHIPRINNRFQGSAHFCSTWYFKSK